MHGVFTLNLVGASCRIKSAVVLLCCLHAPAQLQTVMVPWLIPHDHPCAQKTSIEHPQRWWHAGGCMWHHEQVFTHPAPQARPMHLCARRLQGEG